MISQDGLTDAELPMIRRSGGRRSEANRGLPWSKFVTSSRMAIRLMACPMRRHSLHFGGQLGRTSVDNHLKARAGPDGVHIFNRMTGANILIDEISVPIAGWSSAPRQISVALTNACDLKCLLCSEAPGQVRGLFPRNGVGAWRWRQSQTVGLDAVRITAGRRTSNRGRWTPSSAGQRLYAARNSQWCCLEFGRL